MDLEIINENDGTHSIFMYIPKFIKNCGYYLEQMNNFVGSDWKTGDYDHHRLDRVQRFGLGAVQLHGRETAEYCRNLKALL